MKYKLDLSTKINRLILALGVSLLIGTTVVIITANKTCFQESYGERYLCSCNEEGVMVNYNYKFSNGLISGLMTFSIFLILNGFVKKEQ